MGRTLFQCLVPGCDSTPSKKHNVERHVWLQHVRKWMNCRTQEYQVSLHKRYVESYVGRNHHSCSSNGDLPTPPLTPDCVSECGENQSLNSNVATIKLGSPNTTVITPMVPKFPVTPVFDTYLVDLAANADAVNANKHDPRDFTEDVTAAQQLTLLSQPQPRAPPTDWSAVAASYNQFYPGFQPQRIVPHPHMDMAQVQPRSGLDELAFAACEISRVAAMVGVGPDSLSLDRKHWRPW